MPFPADMVGIGLACGPGPDGHWRCTYSVSVPGAALRALGLHPDQPTSHANEPSPPAWWHAEAERRARNGTRCGVSDAG